MLAGARIAESNESIQRRPRGLQERRQSKVKRYEGLFILNTAAAKEEGIKEALDKISADITAAGGKVETVQKMDRKTFSRVAKTEYDSRRVVLCEPQTFMNASGEAVGAVMKFYQLPLKHLVVAMDDAELPLGEIRLRPGGSSGGHHGLESIESHLGSREYARLRIGIGRKDGAREITGHVLGRLNAGEMAVMEKVLARAADQVECWLAHGLQKAMSQFNGVLEDSKNEGKAK